MFGKEMGQKFLDFLARNDARTIIETIRGLDWVALTKSPYFWVICLPPLIYLIARRRIRTLVFLVSLGAFIFLLQNVLPPPGESIPLNKILEFLGGSIVLAGLNLYFLFMRE